MFTSWREPERVVDEESNFGKIWSGNARRVLTFDVPTAVRDDLLRFLPKADRPARLKRQSRASAPTEKPPPECHSSTDRCDTHSPTCVASCGASSRMHRASPMAANVLARRRPRSRRGRIKCCAFQRMYENWPPKLLIADEVGLGKTIEAGLLLRQAWLAGKARRVVLLAPKALLKQWQIELREKFNLNWPIYDGQKLLWYPSPSMKGRTRARSGPNPMAQGTGGDRVEPSGPSPRPCRRSPRDCGALGPDDSRRSASCAPAFARAPRPRAARIACCG